MRLHFGHSSPPRRHWRTGEVLPQNWHRYPAASFVVVFAVRLSSHMSTPSQHADSPHAAHTVISTWSFARTTTRLISFRPTTRAHASRHVAVSPTPSSR